MFGLKKGFVGEKKDYEDERKYMQLLRLRRRMIVWIEGIYKLF